MNVREILFRGYSEEWGWVYGDYSAPNEEYRYPANIFPRENTVDFNIHEGIEVIPETVGQYTGLTDKNGEKIFEWDILSTGNSDEYLGVVKWDDDIRGLAVSFGGIFESFKSLIFLDNIALEVIGNVYDNPELLGVQE